MTKIEVQYLLIIDAICHEDIMRGRQELGHIISPLLTQGARFSTTQILHIKQFCSVQYKNMSTNHFSTLAVIDPQLTRAWLSLIFTCRRF